LGAAFIIDSTVRIKSWLATERKFREGKISEEERVLIHAKNTTGYVGAWTGVLCGIKCCATAGAAIGTMILPGIGTTIGGAVGSLVGGLGGYLGGEAVGMAAVDQLSQVVNSEGAVRLWLKWFDIKALTILPMPVLSRLSA
jgi:hypothetical protein